MMLHSPMRWMLLLRNLRNKLAFLLEDDNEQAFGFPKEDFQNFATVQNEDFCVLAWLQVQTL